MMEQTCSNSVLLVRVPGAVCALPVSEVIETMRLQPLEPLSNTPDFVQGVALIRGNAVPVVDLRAIFKANPREQPSRLVTVQLGKRCVALAVQSVVGVAELTNQNLEGMPPLLKSARTDVIQAIGTLDAELLVVLRMARSVPESVWKEIETKGSEAAAP
jgi:purine-binding chemotaxis protein CheW